MQNNFPAPIQSLIDQETDQFDPANVTHDRRLQSIVDVVLANYSEIRALNELEEKLARLNESIPLILHLAVKLARSRLVVRTIKKPLHLTVVFAIYKETTRMMTPDQHPHGENFVIKKIEQLQWLFDDIAPVTWDIIIVDDGCPDNSGQLARKIVTEQNPEAPVQILYLQDAISRALPVTHPMKSTSDSQKGGAIAYGMWTATQQQHERHIIAFTDADLSTHLGQSGLLIDGLIHDDKVASIGSRREPTSIVVKKGQRDSRGRLFIYLWKGLIGPLHYITDTQCGFKAFGADTAREILTNLIEKKFAVDIELLLKTELNHRHGISKVPIAWIDSEAESTTLDIRPYYAMLQSIVNMYQTYLTSNPDSDGLAKTIRAMSEQEWEYLSEHVPEAIGNGDPSEFGQVRAVTVDTLVKAMRV